MRSILSRIDLQEWIPVEEMIEEAGRLDQMSSEELQSELEGAIAESGTPIPPTDEMLAVFREFRRVIEYVKWAGLPGLRFAGFIGIVYILDDCAKHPDNAARTQ
jgi:hypothetical protein